MSPADRDLTEPEPWWASRRADLLAAAERGTPAQVFELAGLDAAARAVRAVPGLDRLWFDTAAQPQAEVLAALRRAGCGFECPDLAGAQAVAAAFPRLGPDRVQLAPGPVALEAFAAALAHGAPVVLGNVYPAQAWPELFDGARVWLAVDPDLEAEAPLGGQLESQPEGHLESQPEGHLESQLESHLEDRRGALPGVPRADLLALCAALEAAGAQVLGVRFAVIGRLDHDPTWAALAATWAEVKAARPASAAPLALGLVARGALADAPGLSAAALVRLGARLAALRSGQVERGGAEPGALHLTLGLDLLAPAAAVVARITQTSAGRETPWLATDLDVTHHVGARVGPGARSAAVNLSRWAGALPPEADAVAPRLADARGRLGWPVPPGAEGEVLLWPGCAPPDAGIPVHPL